MLAVLLFSFLPYLLTYWPQYCEGDFILHFAGMRPHWGCSDSRTLVMQYCSGAAKDESAVCSRTLPPSPKAHPSIPETASSSMHRAAL